MTAHHMDMTPTQKKYLDSLLTTSHWLDAKSTMTQNSKLGHPQLSEACRGAEHMLPNRLGKKVSRKLTDLEVRYINGRLLLGDRLVKGRVNAGRRQHDAREGGMPLLGVWFLVAVMLLLLPLVMRMGLTVAALWLVLWMFGAMYATIRSANRWLAPKNLRGTYNPLSTSTVQLDERWQSILDDTREAYERLSKARGERTSPWWSEPLVLEIGSRVAECVDIESKAATLQSEDAKVEILAGVEVARKDLLDLVKSLNVVARGAEQEVEMRLAIEQRETTDELTSRVRALGSERVTGRQIEDAQMRLGSRVQGTVWAPDEN